MWRDITMPIFVQGPYKSQVQSWRRCVTPKPPYITDSPPKVEVEVYNTSSKMNLVKVKVTLEQIYKHLMARIKFYNWDNRKWKFNYMIHSDDCTGSLSIFFKLLALKYDKEDCSIPIGQYIINDIDANTLDHALTNSLTYGRILNRVEVFVKAGTIFCYEFETSVVPA
ncbi:uncharacterized protein LOC128679313 [Plodia interpunctella]|uniref:uncharacterized protein LOC128679313 n=1 Tax=Plodia interpunctella TaxID=58824 RepID=UPI002367E53F|nr:uncharacterized protein LOC128679313 [Plodia interpunctella]